MINKEDWIQYDYAMALLLHHEENAYEIENKKNNDASMLKQDKELALCLSTITSPIQLEYDANTKEDSGHKVDTPPKKRRLVIDLCDSPQKLPAKRRCHGKSSGLKKGRLDKIVMNDNQSFVAFAIDQVKKYHCEMIQITNSSVYSGARCGPSMGTMYNNMLAFLERRPMIEYQIMCKGTKESDFDERKKLVKELTKQLSRAAVERLAWLSSLFAKRYQNNHVGCEIYSRDRSES